MAVFADQQYVIDLTLARQMSNLVWFVGGMDMDARRKSSRMGRSRSPPKRGGGGGRADMI